jgi:hypothetical protein
MRMDWTGLATVAAGAALLLFGGRAAAQPLTPQPLTPQARADYVARAVIPPERLGAFRLFGQQVYRPLPLANQIEGMRAMAGVGLEAPVRYFGNVLLAYSFFDDTRQATAYFNRLDVIGGEERSVVREDNYTLRDDRTGEARRLPLRCVVIPGGDYSLNCHLYDAKTLLVMTMLMSPGPVEADRRLGELPLQTAFRLGGEVRIVELVPVFFGLIPRQ